MKKKIQKIRKFIIISFYHFLDFFSNNYIDKYRTKPWDKNLIYNLLLGYEKDKDKTGWEYIMNDVKKSNEKPENVLNKEMNYWWGKIL